jgi:hypothetical protein
MLYEVKGGILWASTPPEYVRAILQAVAFAEPLKVVGE